MTPVTAFISFKTEEGIERAIRFKKFLAEFDKLKNIQPSSIKSTESNLKKWALVKINKQKLENDKDQDQA